MKKIVNNKERANPQNTETEFTKNSVAQNRNRKKPALKASDPAHFAHSNALADKSQDLLKKQKDAFIQNLSETGLVTEACRTANLARRTAYDYFRSDAEFAARWLDAVETANDDLLSQARRRATKGKSDKLLMYLIGHNERRHKWRRRLIDTGNLVIKTIKTAGEAEGLTEDQIYRIQTAVLESFKAIRLD